MAAAALAFAPLGFAAGALLGAYLNAGAHPAQAGAAMLGHGLFGALAAALTFAGIAALLPPKPARVATLAAGAASFAVAFYLVGNYVAERMAASAALGAAYAALPAFELTLTTDDPQRAPFSTLSYRSPSREYTAERPGGWLCRGTAARDQTVALFTALGAVAVQEADACEQRASWRIGAGAALEGCVEEGGALLAAADAMVDATERKASCRRSSRKLEEPS